MVSAVRFPISPGTLPVKLLEYKANSWSCLHLNRAEARELTIQLVLREIQVLQICSNNHVVRSSSWSLGASPSQEGISPPKLLDLRMTCFSRGSRPSSRGRGSSKLFQLISIFARKNRFPTDGGIVPTRCMLVRFKAVTRPQCLPHVTPIQSQTRTDSDQLVFSTWLFW